GVPDFANPPLPLWLMALAYGIFGVSSFSAIFPSALFGVGIVLLTYRLAYHCFKDSWIAFVAGLI
ncbi:MAG TPA: phospholipid carrier-dependent glycosyltransferase, partial [Nitrospina sp.]|nr:phospholipid carrier-dependent glycosyltransferase [Nitrospina sp.]